MWLKSSSAVTTEFCYIFIRGIAVSAGYIARFVLRNIKRRRVRQGKTAIAAELCNALIDSPAFAAGYITGSFFCFT